MCSICVWSKVKSTLLENLLSFLEKLVCAFLGNKGSLGGTFIHARAPDRSWVGYANGEGCISKQSSNGRRSLVLPDHSFGSNVVNCYFRPWGLGENLTHSALIVCWEWVASLGQWQVRTRHHSHGKGNFPALLLIHGLLGCAAGISFPIVAVMGQEGGIYCGVGAKVGECPSKGEHLLVTGSDSVTLIVVVC